MRWVVLAVLLASWLASAQGQLRYPGDRPGRAVFSAGQPVQTFARTFLCVGDSIMAGACSSASPCSYMAQGITGAFFSQQAVSGETAHQIYGRYQQWRLTGCNGEQCAQVAVEGGVNTLKAVGVGTPAEVAAVAMYGDAGTDGMHDFGMADVVDAALADGRRVVWFGLLPYAGCDAATCPINPQPVERAAAYNALFQQECAARASNKRLTCVSAYSDYEGSPAGYLKPEYACADGLHLQTAGSQYMGSRLRSAFGY